MSAVGYNEAQQKLVKDTIIVHLNKCKKSIIKRIFSCCYGDVCADRSYRDSGKYILHGSYVRYIKKNITSRFDIFAIAD